VIVTLSAAKGIISVMVPFTSFRVTTVANGLKHGLPLTSSRLYGK
jgi:hypothetical protein